MCNKSKGLVVPIPTFPPLLNVTLLSPFQNRSCSVDSSWYIPHFGFDPDCISISALFPVSVFRWRSFSGAAIPIPTFPLMYEILDPLTIHCQIELRSRYSDLIFQRLFPLFPNMVARMYPMIPLGLATPDGRAGSVAWSEEMAPVRVRADAAKGLLAVMIRRRNMARNLRELFVTLKL